MVLLNTSKNDVTKLLEKHNVDTGKTRTKSKNTHTAFLEVCSKELAKQKPKVMGAQEFQDHERVSTIWVKNLKSIANKMNNIKPLIIGMEPKDTAKLGIVKLHK